MLNFNNLNKISQVKAAFFMAVCYLVFFSPASLAFINELPAEVNNIENNGLLSSIMGLVITGASIVAGVGLFAIPVIIIKNSISVLKEIGEGRKTYSDLFALIIVGGIIELVCIGFVYFGWDYLQAAADIVG